MSVTAEQREMSQRSTYNVKAHTAISRASQSAYASSMAQEDLNAGTCVAHSRQSGDTYALPPLYDTGVWS